MTEPFRVVGRKSATDAVRDQLAALINSGQLHVGAKLPPEKELARSLGVSRPVVREALGSLRAIGLVSSQNGRGSFVAAPASARPVLLGRYTVSELHEVRLLLETRGAALAAGRRSDEDLDRLRGIVEAFAACTDLRAWVGLDVAFHVALAEATRNRVHAELLGHLRDLLLELSERVGAVEGRLAAAEAEHRAIFEAVAAGDEAAAAAAMSTHLLNAHSV